MTDGRWQMSRQAASGDDQVLQYMYSIYSSTIQNSDEDDHFNSDE